MFIFEKLILAHLIADFILQFEELYRLKVKSRLGHLGHVFFHAAAMLVLLLPYLRFPRIWLFVAAIATIHYFQDRIKYSYQKRHPETAFYCFTLDQIVHVLFLSTVFLLPESRLELGFPRHEVLDFLYDEPATLVAMAFIITVFKGAYTLHDFRKTFLKDTRPDHFITSFEMTYAFWERGIVTFAILFCPPVFWALSPLAGLPRLAFPKLRNRADFALSFLFAVATGHFIRLWMTHA